MMKSSSFQNAADHAIVNAFADDDVDDDYAGVLTLLFCCYVRLIAVIMSVCSCCFGVGYDGRFCCCFWPCEDDASNEFLGGFLTLGNSNLHYCLRDLPQQPLKLAIQCLLQRFFFCWRGT